MISEPVSLKISLLSSFQAIISINLIWALIISIARLRLLPIIPWRDLIFPIFLYIYFIQAINFVFLSGMEYNICLVISGVRNSEPHLGPSFPSILERIEETSFLLNNTLNLKFCYSNFYSQIGTDNSFVFFTVIIQSLSFDSIDRDFPIVDLNGPQWKLHQWECFANWCLLVQHHSFNYYHDIYHRKQKERSSTYFVSLYILGNAVNKFQQNVGLYQLNAPESRSKLHYQLFEIALSSNVSSSGNWKSDNSRTIS